MGEFDNYTTDELERLYKKYLGESIVNLREGTRNKTNMTGDTNAVSRLDDESHGRQSSNMDIGRRGTTDLSEVREGMSNRMGMQLSGKSYEEILQDIGKGVYRNKDKHVEA